MFFLSLTTQLWSSSHHDSRVKTCHYCFFLISRAILKLLPKPFATGRGQLGITDSLHVSGLSHCTPPKSLKRIFSTLVSNDKRHQSTAGDCCHCLAHVSISGKATNVCRKHCLKKCQFPSLANSSACFQIQRSSFSSSRDQFDRQILLIPKCVISLCDHLPFYLEC